MSRPLTALQSAIAWWEGNVPDHIMGDIVKVTKRVNGGTIGLAHRTEMTEKARTSL
jgi:predicted chitinase